MAILAFVDLKMSFTCLDVRSRNDGILRQGPALEL